MRKIIAGTLIFLGAGLAACTGDNQTTSQSGKPDTATTQSVAGMKNLISIVEIPVTDLARATAFYQSILNVTIEHMEMDGVHMGIFPVKGSEVNVVLAKGADYKPTTDGAILYLNAGDDLQPALDKVEKIGGKILVPKTQISPEMGYFALFIDSEGNKLGLHSGK